MSRERIYPGIHDDRYGGMTDVGRIIRDAWVFGILPETETCAGWSPAQIDALHERVSRAWESHGHIPSRLPPDLRERHERIHAEAVERARSLGWNPELGDDD